MIKFFRKIRQQLIAENRITKYFLYAIGEIILVVIGILIALSINNWSEHQKDLEQEQLILKQLRSEYQSNLAQLDEKILMREQGSAGGRILLEQIDNRETVTPEAFYKELLKIVRDPTFDPIKNDIVGSDKIRLIRNQQLVNLLSNWSTEVYQVQELELEYKKFRTEIILPCIIRLGLSRNLSNDLWKDGFTPTEALDKKYKYQFTLGSSKRDINLAEVLSDTELEGIISQSITFYELGNMQSQTLRGRINQMLEILDQEIVD